MSKAARFWVSLGVLIALYMIGSLFGINPSFWEIVLVSGATSVYWAINEWEL